MRRITLVHIRQITTLEDLEQIRLFEGALERAELGADGEEA